MCDLYYNVYRTQSDNIAGLKGNPQVERRIAYSTLYKIIVHDEKPYSPIGCNIIHDCNNKTVKNKAT